MNTSVARGGKRGPRASEAKASRTPWWSAARRAGPRHGPAVPSAEGTGPTARRPWVRRSAPAPCGAPLPSQEGQQEETSQSPGASRRGNERPRASLDESVMGLLPVVLQFRHPEVAGEAGPRRMNRPGCCNIAAVHPSRLAIARRRRALTRLRLAPQDDGERVPSIQDQTSSPKSPPGYSPGRRR